MCNFSCFFLTCLADPLCRSWERRCLRRSTVTSREQGSREPARQRSGQLWKQWYLEPVTVLRLTNYSTLRIIDKSFRKSYLFSLTFITVFLVTRAQF